MATRAAPMRIAKDFILELSEGKDLRSYVANAVRSCQVLLKICVGEVSKTNQEEVKAIPSYM